MSNALAAFLGEESLEGVRGENWSKRSVSAISTGRVCDCPSGVGAASYRHSGKASIGIFRDDINLSANAGNAINSERTARAYRRSVQLIFAPIVSAWRRQVDVVNFTARVILDANRTVWPRLRLGWKSRKRADGYSNRKPTECLPATSSKERFHNRSPLQYRNPRTGCPKRQTRLRS